AGVMPRVGMRSLEPIARPWWRVLRSAFFAALSASSGVKVTMAFSCGFRRSICAMKAFTTSVAESLRAWISCASFRAGVKQRSWSVMSHQDDIVLFLRIAGFHLHRHRLADEVRQHGERGRF